MLECLGVPGTLLQRAKARCWKLQDPPAVRSVGSRSVVCNRLSIVVVCNRYYLSTVLDAHIAYLMARASLPVAAMVVVERRRSDEAVRARWRGRRGMYGPRSPHHARLIHTETEVLLKDSTQAWFW